MAQKAAKARRLGSTLNSILEEKTKSVQIVDPPEFPFSTQQKKKRKDLKWESRNAKISERKRNSGGGDSSIRKTRQGRRPGGGN